MNRSQYRRFFKRSLTGGGGEPPPGVTTAVTFQDDTPANEGGYALPTGTTAVTGTGSGDFTVSGGKLFKAAAGALPSTSYVLVCNNVASTVLVVTANGPGYDIGEQYDWLDRGGQWVSSTLISGSATIAANRAYSILHAVAQPQNNATVTINGTTYTFKTTVTAVGGSVKIGASLAATIQNLVDAINMAEANGVGGNTAGGSYYVTSAHTTVTAAPYVDADGNWSITRALRVTANTAGVNAYSTSASWTAGKPGGVVGSRGTALESVMTGKTYVFRDGLEVLFGWNGVSGSPMRRFSGSTEIVCKSHNYANKAVIVDRMMQVGGTQAILGFKLAWDGLIGNDRISTASTGTYQSNGLRVEDCEIYGWRAPGARETFPNGGSSINHPDITGTWQGGNGIKNNSFTPNVRVNRNKFYYCVMGASITCAGTIAEFKDNECYAMHMYPWQFVAPAGAAPCPAVATGNKYTRPYLNGGREMSGLTVTSGSPVVTGIECGKAVETSPVFGPFPTYAQLTCFPAGVKILSIAADGLSMTMDKNATASGTFTMAIKQDGQAVEDVYGGSWRPHMDMGIHTGADGMTADWVTVVKNNIWITGGAPGSSGPRAYRDNDGATCTIVDETEGLWVMANDSGASCFDTPSLRDAVVKRNTIVGAPDLYRQLSIPLLQVGIGAVSQGTHHIADNVGPNFSYPHGGDEGYNVAHAASRSTLAAAIQMAGAAGLYGDKLQPLTWQDAVATFAPIAGKSVASGGLMKPDGTYVGALFPNGAWNDGSVYDYASYTWRASHPPIFDDLLVTP